MSISFAGDANNVTIDDIKEFKKKSSDRHGQTQALHKYFVVPVTWLVVVLVLVSIGLLVAHLFRNHVVGDGGGVVVHELVILINQFILCLAVCIICCRIESLHKSKNKDVASNYGEIFAQSDFFEMRRK